MSVLAPATSHNIVMAITYKKSTLAGNMCAAEEQTQEQKVKLFEIKIEEVVQYTSCPLDFVKAGSDHNKTVAHQGYKLCSLKLALSLCL